ncbi:MAG TPA: DUF4232 domain-containing protein [Pseudonocardiaceae bacterium]|nr:DUF4232 domain-containing protein [Pseudonocardiaceae bacterium]
MTRKTVVARVALCATGVAAALVLAACGGGRTTASGSAGTAAPAGTSGSDLGGGSTFIPVTSTTAPPAAGTTTTAAPAGGGGETGGTAECKPANLKLSLGSGDAAAGHIYQALRFTNVSKVNCVIVGFPGLSYVTGDSGTQVGRPAERDGAIGAQITLHPGQVASTVVTETDIDVFDASACKPTATRGFRVYPPDSTASMFIAQTGRGCAGNPPSAQLRVQTIKPGPGNA